VEICERETMSKYIYVDTEVNTLTGQQAKEALEKESDEKFLTEGRGIDRVPIDRWERAQAYERKTWLGKHLSARDDRNHDHLLHFEGYKVLRGLSFSHAIELGCGPFTNLRLIARSCRIERCTLLDPLVEEYLRHPNCSYDRKALFCHRSLLLRNFCKIPIAQIIPSPIEEMSIQVQFDLLVIINVIEHCYDINRVFKKIISVMRKNAYIVFHDKYYDYAETARNAKRIYDAGHPLRVDRKVVGDFINTKFSTVFKKDRRVDYWFEGEDLGYDAFYFIGRLL